MATYTNIATGQVLSQEDFSTLVCNTIYTCCDQSDNVWFTNTDAKNEYQWQQYFEANNLCSDGNAPVNTIAPAISGTLVVGNVLTSTSGTWTSDTGIIPPYTYQWYRGVTLLVGETNNTYTLVQADAGQNIKCVVTACDSDGCTSANSNTVAIFDTILDSMPSPIVAYSISRLLKGSHYGSAIIRVRRSGDNAELDFGVTTLGYLDIVSVVGWVISGGGTQNGFVTTIYEQSGAGVNKVQTTPSSQLQIVAGGVINTLNGNAGMQGSAGKSMILGTNATLKPLHDGTTSYIHAVASLASASQGFLSNNGGGTSQVGTYLGTSTSQRLEFLVSNGTAGQPPILATSATNVFTSTNQVIIGIEIDADNATVGNRLKGYINAGTNVLNNTNAFTPSASNSGQTPTSPTIGFTGIEQEIIIWGVDMSANRTTLRDKTNTFYATY